MGISGGPDIIQDGLVLSLDASDRNSYVSGSTTWFDISGNGGNGTLVNGPTFNSTNGGAIVTDGTDDYITYTSPSAINNISGSDPFTFSVMFRLTQYANQRLTDAANVSSLLMKGSYNPSYGLNVYYDLPSAGVFTRARLYYGTRNLALPSTASGYGNPNYFANTVLSLNQWYQVDFTNEFSGSTYTLNLYVNGTLDRVATSTSIYYPVAYQNSNNLTTATSPLGGNGIISPINIATAKVYNRALSASEVTQNYNAVKSRFNL